MSNHARPTIHGIAILGIALVASIIGSIVVARVASGDDRPTHIRYDLTSRVPTLQVDQLRVPHRRIIVSDHSLNPKEIILNHGEPFGWLSHSRAPSRIVFEREVASAMLCRSLINFSIEEDQLRSSELRVMDMANFCELSPGRYPYRIVRTDPNTGASRRLEGAIIVLPKETAETVQRLAGGVSN